MSHVTKKNCLFEPARGTEHAHEPMIRMVPPWPQFEPRLPPPPPQLMYYNGSLILAHLPEWQLSCQHVGGSWPSSQPPPIPSSPEDQEPSFRVHKVHDKGAVKRITSPTWDNFSLCLASRLSFALWKSPCSLSSPGESRYWSTASGGLGARVGTRRTRKDNGRGDQIQNDIQVELMERLRGKMVTVVVMPWEHRDISNNHC